MSRKPRFGPPKRSVRTAPPGHNGGDELHTGHSKMRGRCSCELCNLTGLSDYSSYDSFMPTLRRAILCVHSEDATLLKQSAQERNNFKSFMGRVCDTMKAASPEVYAKFCKHINVYEISNIAVHYRSTRCISYVVVVRRAHPYTLNPFPNK